MEELIQQLKEDGKAKGLCTEWQNKLVEGVSLQRLIHLYKRGIDFCVNNNFPTLDFIRQHFKGECEQYGVYVDEKELRLLNEDYSVLLGGCIADGEYNGFSVARLVLRHNSTMNIKVSGYAHLTIDLFDNSNITLNTAGDKAKVLVCKYGSSTATYNGSGVKIIQKGTNSY